MPVKQDNAGTSTEKKRLSKSHLSVKVRHVVEKISKNPFVVAGVFIVIGVTTLILSYAFTTPTKGVTINLSTCNATVRCTAGAVASNNALAFNGTGATTAPPPNTSADRIWLQNPLLKNWMNARATTTNPVPTPCVNLECSETGDNGSSPQGQFRLGCQYSHFNTDDPIVYPGQPGKAHLHMFFGNTNTNYATHFDPNDTSANSLTKYGGSSCQGAELNRTAYWMPALLDGGGNVVLPKSIVVYYKSNGTPAQAAATVAMPQGLKMIGGNSKGNTTVTGYHNMVEWNCYDNSQSWQYPNDAYGNKSGTTIPATCPAGHFLHAVVSFPQCWDGKGLELTNTQYQDEQQNCPSGWVHMPQVQYIVDYPTSNSYASWYLSSDRMPGMSAMPNGSTLHGDWYGGWNTDIMNTWTNSCIHPPRNCSLGQMGGSNLHLKRLPKDPVTLEDYAGPFIVKSPI